MAKKNLLKKAEAHAHAGRVKEAEIICRKILKKSPDDTEATFLLSGIMLMEKRYEESESLLQKVLSLNPNHISAMNNLGIVYREHHKNLEKARELFEKVIAAKPTHFRALMNLGNIYSDYGQDELSEAYYKKALEVNPESTENAVLLTNLGNVCFRKKAFDEAIDYLERALKLSPNNTDILRNFLLVHYGKGDKSALMSMIEDVLKLPNPGRAYFPCFSFAKRNCFWDISEKLSEKVVALILAGTSDYSALEMSNLDLLAAPGISYEDLLAIHRITGQTLEGKRMVPPYASHEKAFKDTSKLRIAYLSGDFKQHVINTFIRGLFNFHDRERFEIHCYSNTPNEDKTTEQYKQSADVFIDITGMLDLEVAARIHEDGIHLLVNLAGYTLNSRMAVMAYCAAPVQMMYLGYPYTSGLNTVDYFISDPYLDGPKNAQYFVEKQLRLPECFATFDKLNDREIAPEPPSKKKGYVTFGALVNPYKLTPEVIALWSKIMLDVPQSIIVLNNPKYDFDQMRRKILDVFNKHGIEDARVDIVFEAHESGFHLRYYNEIDIALDTFPLTGGTTTHEALWMGVPVVTLVGDIYPHRLSYTILSNAGMDLSELIAFTEQEYFEKTCALAKNPGRIEVLHRRIPEALDHSIQCDPVRHTQQMEAAYLEAWKQKFPKRVIKWEKASSQTDDPKEMLKEAVEAVQTGEMNQGKTLCLKIFKIDPENFEALNLLGTIHLMEKNYELAAECFELVLSVYPKDTKALNNLGLVCLEYDRDFEDASDYFKKVLLYEPSHVNALMNLGNIHRLLHELQDAEQYYLKALKVDPNNGNVLNNLGSIFAKQGKYAQAKIYYQQALNFLPEQHEILSNLMTVNRIIGDNFNALKLIPKVLKMPNPGAAIFPSYSAAKMYCLWEEANQLLPKVQELIQKRETSFDTFLEVNLSLLATPGISSATFFDDHKKAGDMIDQRREGSAYSDYPKAMQNRNKIRIGYLSPDFHQHVLNIGFRGLMNFHDQEHFEIYCYSNSNIEDEVTAAYKARSSKFINVSELSDRALAERIHDDGIHFLVDLSGYTTNTRIGVMSYRPAPVQMMYLGYSYTSGLSSVDYFITDPYLDGPKNADYFSEKQLRLPESFFSVGHLTDAAIRMDIPYIRNSYITFGSMNNAYKLSPELIKTWAEILLQVPESRMILNHPNFSQEETRNRILCAFEENGLAEDRIDIIWKTHPEESHFLYYNDFDIVLDSFPVTGGTGTIDAIWMGTPLITQVGEIYPHRLSYSILKNIGLEVDDLIAFNTEEYVSKAVALAKNPARIVALHRDIPLQLKKSILCDPYRLTRQMEAAYIRGWNQKFPDQGIDIKVKENTITYLPINAALEIAVPDALDNPEHYILSEQAGWFDPEYAFVLNCLQPGMKVLDLGAGIGSFSLPFSKIIGAKGVCWAMTASSTEAQYLHYSKNHNQLIQLQPKVVDVGKMEIDTVMQKMRVHDLDFIRIAFAEDLENLFSKGDALLKDNSPLIMFRIKKEDGTGMTAAVSKFEALSYQAYRYVPGLKLLVPFISEEDLDVFALNLFVCKTDRAHQLEKQGFLIKGFKTLTELPGIENKAWQQYIGALPYSNSLKDHWINHPIKMEEWENYRVALNLFAQAKDPEVLPEERYTALNSSFGLLALLLKGKPTLPRLFSLVRVMLELGKREASVNFLNQIVSLFESGEKIEFNEPFLALSDEDASIDPGSDFAKWLFASVLKTREMSRTFSTYFSERESLPILQAIKETGFGNARIERQIDLIGECFPQLHPENVAKNKRVALC